MSTATTDLLFRSATEHDIPALVELVDSAYRGEASRAGWTTEADLLAGRRTDAEAMAETMARHDTRVLVAERLGDTGPLACCTVERRPGGAYFGMFSVRPALQGGGVGRAVLAEVERFARAEWSAAQLEMTVIVQRTDLIAWYERRGFSRTGELSPFPYGNERFGVPKRPDLAFERLVKAL
ncbi:GNAT family N-acetyltransferase [Streptacidiphilus fuscans]|uniref:GNAT family N-acetyltransferase n=1 Tax=Streptacidiphilus fuscans TaxID=2789292 RepID=A0A931BBT0_9ACTN|nr:GNAT family N-acetyltransferase [Streptacidiphilus fuscans]MBF9072721.1 GNAT family N-acetyltransferase [Streptacidiphilus fuscans]